MLRQDAGLCGQNSLDFVLASRYTDVFFDKVRTGGHKKGTFCETNPCN